MRNRLLPLLLSLSLLLGGCWDRVELEDMLFPVAVAVDKGSEKAYRVTVSVPVASANRSGILGGHPDVRRGGEILSAESDSVAQAMLIMNAAAARRITMRHVRMLLVSEELARNGLGDLWAELARNGEIRNTIGFTVARGRAAEVLKQQRFPGELNPGKVSEGVLLVEKYLHMAPPIRLHHMLNRVGARGIDPFAPVVALNAKVAQGATERGQTRNSALAGELDRYDGNPVEVAGTAVFRAKRLVGYLTVDETQALLALRGEMGKAYMTFPNPLRPGSRLLMRFQQENLPKYQADLTARGPAITGRLLMEGELLTGQEDYADPGVRRKVETAAAAYMEAKARTVLRKLIDWQVDPVGFGLRFRGQFRRWEDWDRYDWRAHIPQLTARVTVEVRIRRFGLLLSTGQQRKSDE